LQKVVDHKLLFCYNIDMLSSNARHFFKPVRQLFKGNKMTVEKTFSVAGTAKNSDGTVKARFANDLVARIKILNKAGCTDINLVELPRAMTKLEALQYLTEQGITDGDAGYAVANKLAEKAKLAKKGEVKVQAVKAPAKAKSTVTAEEVLEAVKA
jgi:hypothetical protein